MKIMLTDNEIRQKCQQEFFTAETAHIFTLGAQWANEQNAAEIAELVEMLNKAVEFITYEDKLAAWELLKKYGK